MVCLRQHLIPRAKFIDSVKHKTNATKSLKNIYDFTNFFSLSELSEIWFMKVVTSANAGTCCFPVIRNTYILMPTSKDCKKSSGK
jgi:hypothetical protein